MLVVKGQKQCASLMSHIGFGSALGNSFPVPLLAQNGSIVHTANLVDPTLPINGLLPVNAVSCYGCEVIKSAEIDGCKGNFELI